MYIVGKGSCCDMPAKNWPRKLPTLWVQDGNLLTEKSFQFNSYLMFSCHNPLKNCNKQIIIYFLVIHSNKGRNSTLTVICKKPSVWNFKNLISRLLHFKAIIIMRIIGSVLIFSACVLHILQNKQRRKDSVKYWHLTYLLKRWIV